MLKFFLAGAGILAILVLAALLQPERESRAVEIAHLLTDVSGALRNNDGPGACGRMTHGLRSSIVRGEAGSEPASSCDRVVDQYGRSIERALRFDPPNDQTLVMRSGCIDWNGRGGKKLNVKLDPDGVLVYGGLGACPKPTG